MTWDERWGYDPEDPSTYAPPGPPCPVPLAVQVEPREGYTLWIKFDNGTEGLLDMTKDVQRDLRTMKPLRDLETFRRAQIGNEHEDGLLWPDAYPDEGPGRDYYGAWSAEGLYYRVMLNDGKPTDLTMPIWEVERRIREFLETRAA